jgi:FdhD protein
LFCDFFNEISMKNLSNNYILGPLPETPSLTASVVGQDQEGSKITTSVVIERPLTIFLNSQEIVTVMTVGDYPDMLAVGFLLNQNMLRVDDEIISIDFDDDLDVVIVRTKRETNFEQQLKKKTLTSGCAQGTVFGDLMEKFEKISIGSSAILKTTWLYALSQKINSTPSLYLKVGAIHGCVLCKEDQPLIYMEDVGRHNAIDKIAGYMFLNKISAKDKVFYTTGRLTSEMVIKTVQMGIPILISRSGFTAWGVELAKEAGLTLIGRAKGRRFTALSGLDRIIYDADLKKIDDEPENIKRKSANEANGR